MKVRAQAKVNLALDVVGKLENGYHELDMIMAPISMYNDIEIHPFSKDQITCDTIHLPENSTIHKTLQVLRQEGLCHNSYRIHVVKGIPDQAGLAGASADAAAVLTAILQLEKIDLPMHQLWQIGKRIGADVPFCLYKKWARVKGIGEQITPIHTDWKLDCMLVKPNFGISTPEAFQIWHRLPEHHINVDAIQRCIEQKDYLTLMNKMENALEKPAFYIQPSLESLKRLLCKQGADRIMMTGSGSSLMCFAREQSAFQKVKEQAEALSLFVQRIQIG